MLRLSLDLRVEVTYPATADSRGYMIMCARVRGNAVSNRGDIDHFGERMLFSLANGTAALNFRA